MLGPFVRLLGGNDELAVLDGDLDALTGFKPGVLDPFTGELHPRIKRSVFLRSWLPFLVAP